MLVFNKATRLGIMLFAATIMAFASGCASGGFQLTRKYAGFVNKQNIILRIVLYILTGVVFAVTLLIDMVVFNTMDFWDGKVSQGDYKFNKDGNEYAVNHKILDNGLRRSHIEVFGEDKAKLQDVVLQETAEFDIEVYVDGKLKGRIADISSMPQVSLFNSKGEKTSTRALFSDVEWLAIR